MVVQPCQRDNHWFLHAFSLPLATSPSLPTVQNTVFKHTAKPLFHVSTIWQSVHWRGTRPHKRITNSTQTFSWRVFDSKPTVTLRNKKWSTHASLRSSGEPARGLKSLQEPRQGSVYASGCAAVSASVKLESITKTLPTTSTRSGVNTQYFPVACFIAHILNPPPDSGNWRPQTSCKVALTLSTRRL